MSNKKKKGLHSNERLFLEIKGKPGRIYLKGMSFGSLKHINLGVDGHASPSIRSPINLFPENHGVIWEPLHRVLVQYYRNVEDSQSSLAGSNLYETGFSECMIGAETKTNGHPVTRTKYKLLRVSVLDIYRFPKQGAVNDYYEFDFGDYQAF